MGSVPVPRVAAFPLLGRLAPFVRMGKMLNMGHHITIIVANSRRRLCLPCHNGLATGRSRSSCVIVTTEGNSDSEAAATAVRVLSGGGLL